MELLTVTINLLGKTYRLKVEPDTEQYVRQAPLVIKERMDFHHTRGKIDDQEALSYTVLDAMTSLLYANREDDRLRGVMYAQLESLVKTASIEKKPVSEKKSENPESIIKS